PDKQRDWARIQAESQKLLGRLHEWHEFRAGQHRSQKTDLTSLLRLVAAEIDSQNSPLQPDLCPLSEPEFITTSPGDLRRLVFLLVECMAQCRDVVGGSRAHLKVILEPTETTIDVRFRPVDASTDPLLQFAASESGREDSLVAASARALA